MISGLARLDLDGRRFRAGDTSEFVSGVRSDERRFREWAAAIRSASGPIDGEILAARNRALNLVPDHGSLLDETGAFNGRGLAWLFRGRNGMDFNASAEAGRVISNSSTHGGDGPPLDEVARSLLEATGSGYRYQHPHAIAETVAGNGTSVQYEGKYLCLVTLHWADSGAGHRFSASAWVQTLSPSIVIGFPPFPTFRIRLWINGLEATHENGIGGGRVHRLEAEEWNHLAFSQDFSPEAKNTSVAAFLCVDPGTVIRWAMPRAASGAFQLLPHGFPIRTVDRPFL